MARSVVRTSDSSCITSEQEKSSKVDDASWIRGGAERRREGERVNRWQGGKERGASELAALWSEIEMAIGPRHAVIARNCGGKLKLPRSSGGPLSGLATLFAPPPPPSSCPPSYRSIYQERPPNSGASADRLRVTVSPESKRYRRFSAFYRYLCLFLSYLYTNTYTRIEKHPAIRTDVYDICRQMIRFTTFEDKVKKGHFDRRNFNVRV